MIAAPPADCLALVDDCRTARRLFSTTTTKEHVRQQHAHTWTWVSFNQEEDGFTQFMGLLNTQRREDTVVNGVAGFSPVQQR